MRYNSSVLFCGGGTRFALYGGIYEALRDIGKTPDAIIASCGGAMAALVINVFEEAAEQKEYLQSMEFYDFIRNIQLTEHRKLSKLGAFTLKKLFDFRNAPFLEDVFHRYLVELDENLSSHFPTLTNIRFSSHKPTMIIGAKLLFSPEECGSIREHRKLYQKVIFTDKATSHSINPSVIQRDKPQSAVECKILINTDITMTEAVRISMADMFYIKPILIENTYFSGGVVDLVPIELAQHISNEIIAEKKSKYKLMEEALIRAVLGFSANERWRELQRTPTKIQIDTQDVHTALCGYYAQKYIHWAKGEIAIKMPENYADFKESIQKQWQYGYDRTIKSIG